MDKVARRRSWLRHVGLHVATPVDALCSAQGAEAGYGYQRHHRYAQTEFDQALAALA